jgi:glycosyltransferase involved in cell wall biosynthesis
MNFMTSEGEQVAKPLRIAFVANGVYPPDFGGATIRVHSTFLRLRRSYPLSVRVLAMAGERTTHGWSELDGIPVHRLRETRNAARLFIRAGQHFLDEFRRHADVMYTLTTGRLVYISGVWARLLRRPLVVEFVSNDIEETPQRRLMARLLARSAVLAIAISRPVADQFRRLGVPDERIWLRPNPVDTARFRHPSAERRAAARQRFGVDDETFLHVLVGGLVERKNHLVGIAAIERLPDPHRLIIAGPVLPTERDYAAQLARRVRSSPAGGRLSLIDRFVPDIEELMYAADCLWMPSKEEGLGNVMLEALCCGVPCIISNRLGLDEHISDGQDGFKAEPRAEAWSAAVLSVTELFRDIEARRILSERSRAAYDSSAIDAEFFKRLSSLPTRASGALPKSNKIHAVSPDGY